MNAGMPQPGGPWSPNPRLQRESRRDPGEQNFPSGRLGQVKATQIKAPGVLHLILADNLTGLLILAQSEKNRRTQFFVPRPLGKFDFTNENWLYPMHFAHH